MVVLVMIKHFKEEGEPRNCPFCNEPASKGRSFYTLLSKFVYWCGNEKCRLGKSDVKFWYNEWEGLDNESK